MSADGAIGLFLLFITFPCEWQVLYSVTLLIDATFLL